MDNSFRFLKMDPRETLLQADVDVFLLDVQSSIIIRDFT